MTRPAQACLQHPEPEEAQAVCSRGSVQAPGTPKAPGGWAGQVTAPGLVFSPKDGHRASLTLSHEVLLGGTSS